MHFSKAIRESIFFFKSFWLVLRGRALKHVNFHLLLDKQMKQALTNLYLVEEVTRQPKPWNMVNSLASEDNSSKIKAPLSLPCEWR